MANGYDVIVIGSGFGGAITACRLAEKGMKVLILERGRRWQPKDYPRDQGDRWIWDESSPRTQNGWIDLRFFPDMAVVQCAGVGGGSLIYANVFIPAKKQAFDSGWPPEITYEELKPYYDRVGAMLNVQTIPENQLTERYKLMRDAAQKTGFGNRFETLELAVTFNKDWHYGLKDPFNSNKSKTWSNAQGQKQGTCIHLGNCDIGCDVQAKNTLDLNYIPLAEKHGAEVRPLHWVRRIEPENRGYRVHFKRIEKDGLRPGSEFSARVIIAAGSLSSTELLLRCRDQFRTLPQVSGFLGRNWSSNGDFLTPATYDDRRLSPTQGPTITSAIDFLDGSVDGAEFFVEDGGFPDLLGNYLEEVLGRSFWTSRVLKVFFGRLMEKIRARDPLDNVMPWFGQAVDAADGRLYLGRRWWWPWNKVLKLNWDIDKSEKAVQGLIDMHIRLSKATGGHPIVPPHWSILKNLVTPHAIGGCNMGTGPANGVVNHKGEVFGYPNLYVADGAIIPRAIGLNPSRTIAALAERIAEHIE